jgi:hypothetical protein
MAETTVITAPAVRPTTLSLVGGGARGGASAAAKFVIPGARTGFIKVRAKDNATRTFTDKNLAVNPVPIGVKTIARTGKLLATGRYGAIHSFTFRRSDATANPLNRVVGETVTFGRDDFNMIAAMNAPTGANPAPIPGLSAPANNIKDTVGSGFNVIPPGPTPGVVKGQSPRNINNYIGPGVLVRLPRMTIVRQGLHHKSWTGTVSKEFSSGVQHRSLRKVGGAYIFRTYQVLSGVRSPITDDAYSGPTLIKYERIDVTPKIPPAQGIAADGVATGQAEAINPSVPGRNVNWIVVRGPIAFTTPASGAAAGLGAKAIIQSGLVAGRYPIQVRDEIFHNRQKGANVNIVPVRLKRMRATRRRVPVGTLNTTVKVDAHPGGRDVDFELDPVSKARLVAIAPIAPVGAANALPLRQATVTRPKGFTGRVTVTARDRILRGKEDSVRIRFR